MHPIVLVLSYGSMKPESLAKCILEKNKEEERKENVNLNSISYSVYACKIQNKYFETDIYLLPLEVAIESVPSEVLDATEALIVFFDSEDRTFLSKINDLNKCAQNNNIELGMLTTKNLSDDPASGLTFAEVKGACQPLFDLTDLCSSNDAEDEISQDDTSEILEALRNHVWSNVVTGNNSNSEEQELEAFESLLSNLMDFKRASANMSKDELLDEAEKLAERFADLLNDD